MLMMYSINAVGICCVGAYVVKNSKLERRTINHLGAMASFEIVSLFIRRFRACDRRSI